MEKKYPPRVYIFKYKDEQGNEFYEVDLKPFAKNKDDQYLSKEEFDAIVKPLVEALEDLLGCPISVDEATVPKLGIHEAPPYQVVVNASIAWTRLQKAREVLKNYKKQTGE